MKCARPSFKVLQALLAAAILAFAALTAAVHDSTEARPLAPATRKGVNMTIDDSLFDTVPLGSNDQTACSPTDPGEPWRGILVQAPSKVTIPKHRAVSGALMLPLCGTFRLEAAKLYRQGPIKLIVTEQRSGRVYHGDVVDPDPNPLVPPPQESPVDPAELANLVIPGYFNVNVAAYVSIPAVPAVYDIVVEYGKTQSNNVRVAVVAQP